MALFLDARIPVVFGAKPGPSDAVLVPVDEPGHPIGCACCIARSAHASALDLLFLQRVRGEVPWFTRVVVSQESAEIRAALAADPVLSARFRLG